MTAERTRFDFAHNAPMTAEEIREVETLVNAEILANAAPTPRSTDDAQKSGAMMLFGEKYGESVRVLHRLQQRALRRHPRQKATGDIGLSRSWPKAAWRPASAVSRP